MLCEPHARAIHGKLPGQLKPLPFNILEYSCACTYHILVQVALATEATALMKKAIPGSEIVLHLKRKTKRVVIVAKPM